MYTTCRFAIALLAIALSVDSRAATITVADDVNNFESQKRSDTGVYIASENNLSARVGHQSNFNGSGASAPGAIMAVDFFQLPALAPGESVTSASFNVGVVPDSAGTAVTPTFNADLYVLGFVSAIGKTAADAQNYWYIGDTAQASLPGTAGSATVTGSVSRLVDNFLVPADFVANGGTEVLHTANITTYIQNLYANPGPSGFTPGSSFLIVRVNPDAASPPTSGTQRYSLASPGTGPSGNGGTGTTKPSITLETVPEPSSFLLTGILFCATGLLGRNRS